RKSRSPAPPYFGSAHSSRYPCSPAFLNASRSTQPCSRQRSPCGPISFWKKRRADSRKRSCSGSKIVRLIGDDSARSHADGAIQPHVLAVEVAVAAHLDRERRVFLRRAEALREGYRSRERSFDVLRRAHH